MGLTPAALQSILHRHPAPRYWIAYSGGLDSHVLLHLCAQLNAHRFHAIHIHHGLQAQADAWAEHCAATCRDLNLSFVLEKVGARAQAGESQEETARRARYAAISRHLNPGDIVLTAQHRDDQAETLLLQLLRGAGLAGLAAMPEIAPLAPGFLLRPLLGFAREELRDYAVTQQLRWIEDPSNQSNAYDRNFLRNDIIPRLQQRWPGLQKNLARSASHCAEAQQQLNDLAADLYRAALQADGTNLSVSKLRDCKPADQALVLREWLRTQGFRMPSQAVIERIRQEVLPARIDKTPLVSWREGEVRRYRDSLYLLAPLPPLNTQAQFRWDGITPLQLPTGILTAQRTTLPGIALKHWETAKIHVGYRQGGELCRLPNRNGTHELKKLFQEKGIPPWLRERVPLVYLNGELAAVGSWWVCAEFAGIVGDNNIALQWQ
jgi:tRNA(Ile)-lysidine synthase